MFDLRDVRYVEGAPMEWRRWLTPGTEVVLRFSECGVRIYAAGGDAEVAWDAFTSVDVRGPDTPERRRSGPGRAGVTGYLLGGPLLGLLAGAVAATRPKERFSWLAFDLLGGNEVIFEVAGMLRGELEEVLEGHSG